MSSPPLIDLSRLEAMFGDDPALIDSLLKTYLESLDEQLAALRTALENDVDLAKARLAAHSIKGSASEYGSRPLAEAAGRLEDACQAADERAVRKEYALFADTHSQTRAVVEKIVEAS